jgi:hypothetical protein
MMYQNFYIKAPVAMLEIPLPLSTFLKEDGSHMTIPEYLEGICHTVERFSSDGFFIKGFGFNFDGLKELESRLSDFGLIIGTNVWILSPVEVLEELEKDIWIAG